jgi:Ras-related protein Rab-2A
MKSHNLLINKNNNVKEDTYVKYLELNGHPTSDDLSNTGHSSDLDSLERSYCNNEDPVEIFEIKSDNENQKDDLNELVDVNISEPIESTVIDVKDIDGYDHTLKFIVVGNSCVGKSNLTHRFVQNEFIPESDTTIGVEFASKIVCTDSKVYKIQIWDTAGQDTFKTITRSYYRNSIGCIIVYDITNRESFNDVKIWFEELIESSQPYTGKQSIVIVGNKMDISDRREVSFEEGKDLADKLGCYFSESSAKTGVNVKKIFTNIVIDINNKIKRSELELINKSNIILTNSEPSYLAFCGC